MNGKERSLAAFRGQEPDRVLMYVTVVSEVVDGLSQVADIPTYHCDDFLIPGRDAQMTIECEELARSP